jgi:4-amino-4-deoxy-L-arabinose transferase-like glycosyltransferase
MVARHRGRMALVAIAFGGMVGLLTTFSPSAWTDRETRIANRIVALSQGVPDASGRTSPFLVHDESERWYPPLAVYPAAWLVQAGVSTQVAARLPAAIAAALSALLLADVAALMFRESRLLALSVGLLMLTPAWLTAGRTAGGDLLMVPAILAWLAAVLRWCDHPRSWVLTAGGVALGLSAWTQPAGVLAVPIYFLLGGLTIWRRARDPRAILSAAFGVAAPFAVYAVWFLQHPDAYLDTFGRWAIHPAHIRRPWDGIVAATKWDVLGRRASAYWEYLNPTFLFDGRAIFGTAMAVPIALGWWAARAEACRPPGILTMAFFAAPLGGVLLDVPRDPFLVLALAPFGALVGARGLDVLLTRGRAAARLVAALLVLLLVLGALNSLRA